MNKKIINNKNILFAIGIIAMLFSVLSFTFKLFSFICAIVAFITFGMGIFLLIIQQKKNV
jgi:hypothetical protein